MNVLVSSSLIIYLLFRVDTNTDYLNEIYKSFKKKSFIAKIVLENAIKIFCRTRMCNKFKKKHVRCFVTYQNYV